jgi:hypothetical protein
VHDRFMADHAVTAHHRGVAGVPCSTQPSWTLVWTAFSLQMGNFFRS